MLNIFLKLAEEMRPQAQSFAGADMGGPPCLSISAQVWGRLRPFIS